MCGMLAPAAGPRRGAQTAGERWEGGEGRRSPPGGDGAGGNPRGSRRRVRVPHSELPAGRAAVCELFFFLCLFVYLIVVFILPPCCRGKPALRWRGTERCRAARLAGTPAPRRPPESPQHSGGRFLLLVSGAEPVPCAGLGTEERGDGEEPV